jgi:DNA-binding transcriptional LysR family regulator
LAAIDLNLLVVLDTVLTERSVGKAARRLHVTPSAVSNALARLRLVLGDPLLVRSGRGVVPTPRALALAPTLSLVLRDLERAIHGDFDPRTTERELTLALADVGQVVRLPDCVVALGRRMPRARLRVVSIDGLVSLGGVESTSIDAVVGAGETRPGVHARRLYDEKLVLVARAGHRQVGPRVTSAQLAALRHVDVELAPGRPNARLAAAYVALRIPRDVAVVVPTFIAAAAIVAKSELVAALPESLVEILGRRFGLRAVRAPLPPLSTPIVLSWHDRTDHDPALRLFREVLVATLGR